MRGLIASVSTALVAFVAACSSSNPTSTSADLSDPGGTVSTSDLSFAAGCDWSTALDVSNNNYAYPETHSTYWLAVGPTTPAPGMRLRIEGRYANARYFSLQVYNGHGAIEGGLADFQITPDVAGTNTFSSDTARSGAAPGGTFTAYVNFEAAPAVADVNTIYRSSAMANANAVRKRTYLILRVYLPANGAGEDGGYGLPTLVLETPGGEIPLSQTPDAAACGQLYNRIVDHSASHINLIGKPPHNPPRFQSFKGIANGLLGPGVLYNEDSAYVYATTSLRKGELQLVRAQAPTFTDEPSGPAGPQVRYWSICQNDYVTQAVSACVADADAVLDSGGFFNVVISDPANRPANATVANGFNWLPYGDTQFKGNILYRNLVTSPTFTQGTKDTPVFGDLSRTMGDYAPQATYCSRATFEASQGLSPQAVFDACKAASSP